MGVIVIGNVNVDLMLGPLQSLPSWGREYVVPSLEFRTAGAAAYTAMALASLGEQVSLIGSVGDDYLGQQMLTDLRHFPNLDLRGVTEMQGQCSGLGATFVNPGGERCFVTYLGHLSDTTIDHLSMHLEERSPQDVLFCGYFLLPKLRGSATAELMKRVRIAGGRVWFDTGWDPDNWSPETVSEVLGILPHVDVFLPNEDESRTLTGTENPEKQAKRLLAAGVRQVIIKLGSKGALAATGQDIVHMPGKQVVVQDTTGAGDVFNSGCLYGTAREWPTKDILGFANSVAACYISAVPRRFPTLEDV